MTNNTELRVAVAEMSKRFESRYGYHWISSNDIDDRENLREKLLQWIDEFEREGIKPKTILEITDLILDKVEFSNYPPTLNKFIFICKEMSRMFGEGESGLLYLEMKKLDEKFSFIYGRLWVEQDKDKGRRRLDYWMREILSKGISHKTLSVTLHKIKDKGSYIQYPPSLHQLVLECLFESIGDDFIDPEVAYIRAKSRDEDSHPVIRTTRQKIGSHTLKTDKNSASKKLFEKIYLDECNNYVSNPIKYLDSVKLMLTNKENVVQENFSIADNNSDFFNLLAKKHP